MTSYGHLKKDILRAIHEQHVLVTTLIDYYALPSDFPKYAIARAIRDKQAQVEFLERSILEDIHGSDYGTNLFPYIQLHEFEALVFTGMKGFEKIFSAEDADFDELQRVLDGHENPEDINDGKETAPSKRLKKLVRSYNKVVDGNRIIEFNGIEILLEKCPRFRNWVQSIVNQLLFS